MLMPQYILKSAEMVSPTRSLVYFEKDGVSVQHEIKAEWLNDGLCLVSCADQMYNQDLLDDKVLMGFDQSVGSLFWLNNELENSNSQTYIRHFECELLNFPKRFNILFGGVTQSEVSFEVSVDGNMPVKRNDPLPEAFQNEKLKLALEQIILRIASLSYSKA